MIKPVGLGGICESDLRSTMIHIIFQGLVGRPGFVSDPTVDESRGSIILAHCMGTPQMDGPAKPAAPYKNRTVLERQEGVVTQIDLPRLYGVATRRLNEQVKRNRERFPPDFVFELTFDEKEEVVAKCNHLARIKFSPVRPNAFTEHGAIILLCLRETPT